MRIRLREWLITLTFGLALGVTGGSHLAAQTVQGTVVDADNGRPVPEAGVYLLDRNHNSILVAMADSLGRYAITVPDGGDYFLVAERFGYRDMESPLLALSDSADYALDLEMQPQPLGLGEITVTARNEQVIDWLSREFGKNPSEDFGFRLLQGQRLAEAKAKGQFKPTETLRWLYIPVSHGLECVSINTTPRAQTVGWMIGPRETSADRVGKAPTGTTSKQQRLAALEAGRDRCGTLMVNDRVVPNDHLDSVDMSSIAVVVTLPGMVRMYTYGFNWSFRE